MRRTLLILAISASVALSGCSAIGGGGGGNGGPGPRNLCEQKVATGAQTAEGPERIAALDAAIRSCRSLDQWTAAVEAFGATAVSPDATTYLGARCAEPTSGVGGYMLCGLLAASLVTPKPAPTNKAKHKPKKTPRPKRSPTPAPLAATPIPPVPQVAPVPPVPSAVSASPLSGG